MVFHPNFSHPLTIFHHKLPAREGRVWGPRPREERAWRGGGRGAAEQLGEGAA